MLNWTWLDTRLGAWARVNRLVVISPYVLQASVSNSVCTFLEKKDNHPRKLTLGVLPSELSYTTKQDKNSLGNDVKWFVCLF